MVMLLYVGILPVVKNAISLKPRVEVEVATMDKVR